jgi:hypothetical protein
VSCPATPFSEERPPDPNTASFSRWWYHNDGIWVALAPPYEGRWYAGEPALKVLWYSEVAGELRITGTRLDTPGAVLSAEVPSGYEQPVQTVVRNYVGRFADEVRTDWHGNVIAAVNPAMTRKKLMYQLCQ